ncbi:hypothetical protein pb186bvf_014377 [Paramecium bursaria]
MQSVWSIVYPTQTSMSRAIKHLLPAGEEFLGTVEKQGQYNKTIFVRVTYKFWNAHYKRYGSGNSIFKVHDEDNSCAVGDKVVIKRCQKLTENKYYFVRNIVMPAGRDVKETDDVMEELQKIRKSLIQ